MHRFYLSPEQARGEALTLEGREAHHAANVLRIGRQDQVTVLNGAGEEWLCKVVDANRRQLTLSVVQKRSFPPPPCRITLAQALPKGKLFESIVQKATELGVTEIVPLLSERVTADLDQTHRDHKRDKWQAVAVEAIKQCGAPWLPKVHAPLAPKQFLEPGLRFEFAIVGSLQPGAQHPRKICDSFFRKHARAPRSACVWIGPEGDFTMGELELIQAGGASPVTLGPLVLRTETAAMYCLSILNYEFSAGARD